MDVVLYLLFGNERLDAERRRRNQAFRQLRRIRRHLRDSLNPFTMEAESFRTYYRTPPAVAMALVNLLQDDIRRLDNTSLPPHIQVLSALRFFAEGSYQKGVEQDFHHNMSQPSISRCLNNVVTVLSSISHQWIRFPQTREERQRIRNRFLQDSRNILGLIDCFVVKITRPAQNEEAFFHHKHAHSLNIQVVSDDNYMIQSIRICPGSNNDKFIWKYSDIKQHMLSLRENSDVVQEEGSYYLLGDSGYTPSTIMLTPIKNVPLHSAEGRYTHQHVRTRCKIEQCFGILSNVWQAISRRRTLYYSPRKAAKIVLACAVLHNFRRMHGVNDLIPEVTENNNDEEEVNHHRDRSYLEGIQERQRLVNLYYD